MDTLHPAITGSEPWHSTLHKWCTCQMSHCSTSNIGMAFLLSAYYIVNHSKVQPTQLDAATAAIVVVGKCMPKQTPICQSMHYGTKHSAEKVETFATLPTKDSTKIIDASKPAFQTVIYIAQPCTATPRHHQPCSLQTVPPTSAQET